MLEIDQYYSDVDSHDLPFTSAKLVFDRSYAEAYILESTKWAGFVRTEFPVRYLEYDNRGEPFRAFALAKGVKGSFPIEIRDATRIVKAYPEIKISNELEKALVSRLER